MVGTRCSTLSHNIKTHSMFRNQRWLTGREDRFQLLSPAVKAEIFDDCGNPLTASANDVPVKGCYNALPAAKAMPWPNDELVFLKFKFSIN